MKNVEKDLKKQKKLKMYSVYANRQDEGACLVFHYTAREAKKISYSIVMDWFEEIEFIDIKIKQIKNSPWLWKEKIKDGPHVIESPKSCDDCFRWGYSELEPSVVSGATCWLCADCRGED